MAMQMSKLKLTQILQKAEMWDEAQLFMDGRRSHYQQKGWSKAKANATAWQEAERKFAHKATVKADEAKAKEEAEKAAKKAERDASKSKPKLELPANVDIDALEADLSPAQFVADAMWVYARVAAPMDDVGAPPSAGALGMLMWAKDQPQKFFEQMMPKVLAIHEKRAKQDEVDEDAAKELDRVEELRAMLGVLKEEVEGA